MAYFSNELPSSDDHGTPEWNEKYAKLVQVVQDKLHPADELQDVADSTPEQSSEGDR